MSQTNFVTYSIALTAENADKITAMNHILLDGATPIPKPAGTATETAGSTATKTSDPVSAGTTASEFKAAAKKVKADHGEEFALKVLTDFEITNGSTLGRSIGKVGAEQYDDIMAAWAAGPQAAAMGAAGSGAGALRRPAPCVVEPGPDPPWLGAVPARPADGGGEGDPRRGRRRIGAAVGPGDELCRARQLRDGGAGHGRPR